MRKYKDKRLLDIGKTIMKRSLYMSLFLNLSPSSNYRIFIIIRLIKIFTTIIIL